MPDYNRRYFSGRFLAVFCTLVVILLTNGVAASVLAASPAPLLPMVISLGFFLSAFLSFANGFNSSNTGSYFRDREPIRFWTNSILPAAVSILVGIGAWFI